MKKNYLEPEMKISEFEQDVLTDNSGIVQQSAEDMAKAEINKQFNGRSVSFQSVEWTF